MTDGVPILPREARAAIEVAAGPGGIVDRADAAPMLEEWRGRWRGDPCLVVAPDTVDAVARLVRACADNDIAITPQGGNTGLVGAQMATKGEVLLSLRRLNRIRDVSPRDNAMTLEAGVTLSAAQEAARRRRQTVPAFDRV